MAMAVRSGEETRQLQVVCLDELVPADDRLRRVEELVSWTAVRATAAPFYTDFGRPSVDPVVLVKLLLGGALRGIGSLRELMRVAELDLSMRRFIGYGLTEALPHYSTLSLAQCVRFASSGVFEQLFTQVLAQCRQAGLLDGGRLVVDATHVEADAALKSLRAELTVIDGGSETHADDQADESDGDGGDGAGARPPLALAAPRSGPTPKRTATNATAVSRTDPDGKLRHQPTAAAFGASRADRYRPQAPRHRGRRGRAGDRVRRRRAARASPPGALGRASGERPRGAADQGYASRSVYQQLERLAVTAFIPPQAAHARTVPEAARARARCRTAAGIRAAADRQAHAEGAISELKLRHGLDRARRRGTHALQLQLLVAATAVNLKRLLTRPSAAENLPAGDQDNAAGRRPAAVARYLSLVGRNLSLRAHALA